MWGCCIVRVLWPVSGRGGCGLCVCWGGNSRSEAEAEPCVPRKPTAGWRDGRGCATAVQEERNTSAETSTSTSAKSCCRYFKNNEHIFLLIFSKRHGIKRHMYTCTSLLLKPISRFRCCLTLLQQMRTDVTQPLEGIICPSPHRRQVTAVLVGVYLDEILQVIILPACASSPCN